MLMQMQEPAPPKFDKTISLTSALVSTGARFDAAMDMGSGLVLIGNRTATPGNVFSSTEYGDPATFSLVTNLGSEISNMVASGGKGYVLLATSEVFETPDGVNFTSLGVASSSTSTLEFKAYSMARTPAGTLLVCDTKTDGGHIWRKTPGGSWADTGAYSGNSLYRLQVVADGVLCISFNGKVYKTTDDGVTWNLAATLTTSALFAIEYLENGIVLIVDADGKVWRSTNNGDSWGMTGTLDGSADDMAYLGEGLVFYASYTSQKNVYFSPDYGVQWRSLGPLQTTAGDIWEHIIPVVLEDGSKVCFGGTNLGFAVRAIVI